MLRNQIANQRSKGFLSLLFDKGPCNVAGHGIRPSFTHRTVDSGELLLGKRNGDFRGCHTGIIPSPDPLEYRNSGDAASFGLFKRPR